MLDKKIYEVKNTYPLLAIRCFTYNHEPYIRQCLEGFVSQQTNFPFIVIVHDDASNDKTADIIREYEKKYPDIIKPIIEKTNLYIKGDGSLRRVMYNAIPKDVKYIAFCEGDDYWTDSNKLQRQVDYLESHPKTDACFTDCDIFFQETGKWQYSIVKNKFSKIFPNNPFESSNYACNLTWVYKKSLLDGDPYKFRHSVDSPLLFWYYIALNAKIDYIDISTGVYRRHINSESYKKNNVEKDKFTLSVYKDKLLYIDKFYAIEKRDCVYANCYAVMLGCAIRLGFESEIVEYKEKLYSLNTRDIVKMIEKLNKLSLDWDELRKSKSLRIGNIVAFPFRAIMKFL